MKIGELIDELEKVKASRGDIEVTVTGAHLPDGYESRGGGMSDVFETTCENLIIRDKTEGTFGRKRVRLYF